MRTENDTYISWTVIINYLPHPVVSNHSIYEALKSIMQKINT